MTHRTLATAWLILFAGSAPAAEITAKQAQAITKEAVKAQCEELLKTIFEEIALAAGRGEDHCTVETLIPLPPCSTSRLYMERRLFDHGYRYSFAKMVCRNSRGDYYQTEIHIFWGQ